MPTSSEPPYGPGRELRDDGTGDTDLDRVFTGDVDRKSLAALGRALSTSARAAGATAVTSGRWLAEWLVDNAPRIPIRDDASLRARYGKGGPELAEELIRSASRASAGVGATAGALVGLEELSPPAWLTIPVELLAETVAIAFIELKLVGELHEVFGQPVVGSPVERSVALVRSWAERRGVTPTALGRPGGVADALGRQVRNDMVRLVRRRLVGRLGRNLSTLVPLMAGAIAGAEVNRRATRSLGRAVARDLGSRPAPVMPQ